MSAAVIVATEETQADPRTRLWICEVCGLVYDPAEGDPDGGIPPGTPLEEIPRDWICPVCGARATDFRPLEVGEEVEGL
jgi:rubredoxin